MIVALISVLSTLVLVLGGLFVWQINLNAGNTVSNAPSPTVTRSKDTSYVSKGRVTSSPSPAQTVSPDVPTNEPQAPNCPIGDVKIGWGVTIYDPGGGGSLAAIFTGLVQNDSDSSIQVLGLPQGWGLDASGANLVPLAGAWDANVDNVLPGQRIGFKSSPITQITAETAAAVAAWKFSEDHVSANYLGAESGCYTKVDIQFVDMGY